jgi:glycosyltransferase involved in cell wall biosynthesis
LGIPPVENHRNPKRVDEKVRFCYFGNILPIKGIHLLIHAFRALPEGKAKLTIYGDRNHWTGAYYDHLEEQTHGFPIQFRPSFPREKLSEALSDQDVVVLPSICPESFSFVIKEANHLGLPVIASKIGAIPEAVKDGGNGLLFEPGNVEDLKRCMLRFIETPQLVQEMALKMPKVKSMAEHALELEEVYQGVIRRRG